MAGKADKANDSGKEALDIETKESRCGIGSFQPEALQCFRTVLSFTIFYGIASMVSQTMGAYYVSQVTALEKQFSLSSITTGTILSCNDIGFLCAVLILSHFGRNGHIPRILSAANVLFGVAGILASMCHFLDPAYLPKLSDGSLTNFSRGGGFVAPLCVGDNETAVKNCDGNAMVQSSGLPAWPVWVLGTSMFLQGIAKAPRVSLSSTYIDNNITVKTKTGFYIGIAATLNFLGPPIAIALGGVFRTVPVDLQGETKSTIVAMYISKSCPAAYGGCREVKTGEATAGMCETDCPYLYYYLAADVGLKLVGTSAILPVYMTFIRSVDPKDKTIAMGLYQFLSSLLGFLPAPILFGYVIDSTCLIFGESCGIRGTCAQYDLQNLRFRLKSTECTGRGISVVLLILAYIILKRQGGDKEVNDEVEFECKKAEKSEMTITVN